MKAPLVQNNKKYQKQTEDLEAEFIQQQKKKNVKVEYNPNSMPNESITVKCPQCKFKGKTVMTKSCSDRGKVVMFYGIIAIFVGCFFIFILAYMVLHMVLCNKDKKTNFGNCCTCKRIFGLFEKCRPKVHAQHHC